MLSILRQHSGWGLKIVLSIVCLSFVLFFGYSSIQRQQGSDSPALQVGGETISYSWYRFFYNNQYQNIREKFKEGEIPDFLVKNIRQSSERQVVQRSLTGQFALSLGMAVSDQELARFVTQSKDFDPVEYKNFIQYFFRENGFAYEDLMREDLLLQKFQSWAEKMEIHGGPQSNTQWTFETAELEGADKKGLAEQIQAAWSQGKKAAGAAAQKIGPIGLAERKQLFHGDLGLEEYAAFFSLKPHTGPAKPFEKGNRFLLVRLLEKKEAVPDKNGPKPKEFYPEVRLIDVWFQNFAGKTKIKSLIQEDAL